jgi:hypothetical protein
MKTRTLVLSLALTAALPTVGPLAQTSRWYVYLTPERTCVVSDARISGYGRLAGPLASKSQAMAEKDGLATCSKANTERSTGTGPAR